MKRIALALLATVMIAGCNDNKESEGWRVGYSLGHNIGERMREELPDIDIDGFVAGVRDGYTGEKKQALTQEEMQQTVREYQQKRFAQARDEAKARTERNATEGKAFLDANAKKPGVKVTASGLQYEVLAEGKGPKPKATDIVKARYHGTLPDGTVFDSTRQRGDEPAEFPLNRVIPGWTEGLQLMNRGAKYRFVLPPELGYGAQGAGEKIGPGQVLVFEVELVDFADAGKAMGGK